MLKVKEKVELIMVLFTIRERRESTHLARDTMGYLLDKTNFVFGILQELLGR